MMSPGHEKTERPVRHFVHYHNPDVMGQDAMLLHDLHVVPNKNVGQDLYGQRIWLLTGRGRPREYLVCLTFIVDSLQSDPEARFRTRISGEHGTTLQPFVRVGDLNWFPKLRRATGNFAFGLQPITDPDIIAGLSAVADVGP